MQFYVGNMPKADVLFRKIGFSLEQPLVRLFWVTCLFRSWLVTIWEASRFSAFCLAGWVAGRSLRSARIIIRTYFESQNRETLRNQESKKQIGFVSLWSNTASTAHILSVWNHEVRKCKRSIQTFVQLPERGLTEWRHNNSQN